MIFLEWTRGHRQSNEHCDCFKGNVREASYRQGGAIAGFSESINTILNWTELQAFAVPVSPSGQGPDNCIGPRLHVLAVPVSPPGQGPDNCMPSPLLYLRPVRDKTTACPRRSCISTRSRTRQLHRSMAARPCRSCISVRSGTRLQVCITSTPSSLCSLRMQLMRRFSASAAISLRISRSLIRAGSDRAWGQSSTTPRIASTICSLVVYLKALSRRCFFSSL